MDKFLDFWLMFLTQIGGGPGPAENNLVRFALPAIFWAVLLAFAWSRQRHGGLPREKLLVWGFGLGLARELLMFTSLMIRILNESAHVKLCTVVDPVEHALALASVVMIAGSFLRYILDDELLARRYIQTGLGTAVLGLFATSLWWPRQLATDPGVRFHETPSASLLHLLASGVLAVAVVILARKRGWLRNIVLLALSFLFLGEFLILLNLVTNRAYGKLLCPIGNNFHVWAVPLFGFVYLREQSIDKQRAEQALKAHRDHLEEQVAARTVELTNTNAQLQSEVAERARAEAEIARRNAELAAQNAISATISQSLDLEVILNAALDRALAVLGMESGCIFLLDPAGGDLALQAYVGNTTSVEAIEENAQLCLCRDISHQAVTGLKPVITKVSDHLDQCRYPFAAEDGLQLLVSTPLVSQGRAVGALTLGAQRTDAIAPQELQVLTAIGQQIGVAVENARLYRETQRWAEGMAQLHEASVFLSSTLDPLEVYDQIARQSARLITCPAACLFCWNEEHQHAVGVSSYGLDGQRIEGLRLDPGENAILSQLILQRRSIALENAPEDPRIPASLRDRFQPKALLCLPVWGADKPLGFLFMIDPHQARRWRSDEVDLLESFADRAAVALENAHLHKQLEWAAALEERQRIAAEMHDGLAQTLSYLGLNTDRAAELLEDGQIQPVLDEFRHMQEAIGEAARDVRRSIATLQESPPPRQSLQDALSRTVDQFAADAKLTARLHSSLQAPLFLPPGELDQVSRVVQEALLNARRHARARNITLRLDRLEDVFAVVVQDDGRGFDPARVAKKQGDHFGLSIMRARAARIAGKIKIDSRPGQGTRVTLTWPASSGSDNADWADERHPLDRQALPML